MYNVLISINTCVIHTDIIARTHPVSTLLNLIPLTLSDVEILNMSRREIKKSVGHSEGSKVKSNKSKLNSNFTIGPHTNAGPKDSCRCTSALTWPSSEKTGEGREAGERAGDVTSGRVCLITFSEWETEGVSQQRKGHCGGVTGMAPHS
ncbi:hypothetical protein JOB18_004262 [Solea senegalensis]|uniref:Uncharacterized protein n=1 Tax=Solea senegalensis TaxID=28829 RepID=A0AAV6PUC0_SOLSE|nr:hypothetical protein JOB18_004262 [Solea senegalensis]